MPIYPRRHPEILCFAALVLFACGGDENTTWPKDDAGDFDSGTRLDTDTSVGDTAQDSAQNDPQDLGMDSAGDSGSDSAHAPCPDGVICVDSFPFAHAGDTSTSGTSDFDVYSCKTSSDESGPEIIYQIDVPEDGFLSAAVYDTGGVDVDVHILTALDPAACLDRGHHHARAHVGPGTYYVVVDTFVGSDVFSGPYRVEIGHYIPSRGPCATETGFMERVRDGGDHLQMPATGPVVLEAHLVTQEEPQPYPSTSTEELDEHYVMSQERSGFVMHRSQNWAPLEGGNFYGAGIGSPDLFPVIDEHWYVCMFWTRDARPARGTKMIFKDPESEHAVVVAAGYETGPGDLDNIAGTTEETHFYLGTPHQGQLQLGIATDQALPFGPRICE
jgi:hypothetical protein